MFELIEGMPPDVLAIEAVGKVTHEDYWTILIPKAEAMMAKGPIKMIYVIGEGFSGFDLEALWDDDAFGIKHWHEFKQIAVVADLVWLRASISMFAPFFPPKCGSSIYPNFPPRRIGSSTPNMLPHDR